MEDSFRVRVDKIFGSLSSSSPTTALPSFSLSSLWSLTEDEIERREWNRDNGTPENELESRPDLFASHRKPAGKSSVGSWNELGKDLDDLQDDDDDDDDNVDEGPRSSGPSSKSIKPDNSGDEEWEIKHSIGLDCTLDYEEEEDQYDKVAIGKENEGDRLYMKDIADYGINIDSSGVFPDSINDITRDPRANHLAAKIRLQEDAKAANKIDSLQVARIDGPDSVDAECSSEYPKSILKRKDNHLDSKSQKRVRFNPECKETCNQETKGSKDTPMEPCTSESEQLSNEGSIPGEGYHQSGVPDYIRNPSRYTHYTFDSSSDMDEESNKQSYIEFLKMVKGSHSRESQPIDSPIDLQKSITFIPRKKPVDAIMLENSAQVGENKDGVLKELVHHRGMSIGTAAADPETDNVCPMEEDEPEKLADKRNSARKVGRQYRTRAKVDPNDS